MADYNIYIHNIGGDATTEGSPTTAWGGGKATPTTAWKSQAQLQASAETGSTESSSSGLALAFRGVTATAKSHPAIAAAIAAYAVIDRIMSVVSPNLAKDTGDYTQNVAYQNARGMLNSVLNPFSAGYTILTAVRDINQKNKAKEQERLLLGDSYINSMVRRH